MKENVVIFIEGNDDERFFNWYFNANINVKFVKYAQTSDARINAYIKSINSIPDTDYIFISDIDDSTNDKKINDLKKRYNNLCDNKIVIVKLEIESWFLAGINEKYCQKFNIKNFIDTNNISKEKFDQLIPMRLGRIDFMIEILNNFDYDIASQKNKSFFDFNEKYSMYRVT